MKIMRTIDIAFTDLRNEENWNSEKIQRSRNFKTTLVVPAESSALTTARIADDNGIRFILVRGKKGELAGLILPAWTRRQIGAMYNQNFDTLTEALSAHKTYRGSQGYNFSFHSERLNQDRPAMSWCNAGHTVDGCPCDIPGHQKLGCSPQSV